MSFFFIRWNFNFSGGDAAKWRNVSAIRQVFRHYASSSICAVHTILCDSEIKVVSVSAELITYRSEVELRGAEYTRDLYEKRKNSNKRFLLSISEIRVSFERYSIKSAKQKTLSSKRNERQKRWHAFASLRQIV